MVLLFLNFSLLGVDIVDILKILLISLNNMIIGILRYMKLIVMDRIIISVNKWVLDHILKCQYFKMAPFNKVWTVSILIQLLNNSLLNIIEQFKFINNLIKNKFYLNITNKNINNKLQL